MAETLKLFYYASRQFTQDSCCCGVLRPGPSGVVYLSRYRAITGVEAVGTLSLNSPIEFRCEIKVEPSELLRGPFPVQQIYSIDGFLVRPGGGFEFTYEGTIEIGRSPQWTALRPP